MHNSPSFDNSGASSGDSGHVSETENRRSTKMRRSSTTGTDLRNYNEPTRYGGALIHSRRTSSSKNSGPYRQGSLSSAEGNETAPNGFVQHSRLQEPMFLQAQASQRGPEFRLGSRNASRLKVDQKDSRRNSTGCMYQIWRLASQVPHGPHDGVANGYDVAVDSSAFVEEGAPQRQVLPPLKGSNRQPESKIPVRVKNTSAQPRKRNNSGPERSFLQSSRSEERRTSLSPIPPGRRVTPDRDRRSASVDYSAMQTDYKPLGGRKSPSPYKPAHRRNESNGKVSLGNEPQNTFIVTRTAPPQAESRKSYAVVPSCVQAFGPGSGESASISRPQSRKLRANFRSNSVYSPSSGGSGDRPPDRVVVRGKRRASLPTTALLGGGAGFDANRSPEFYKTFNELRRGLSGTLDTRDFTDQRTPSARSGSTVNSYKEQMAQGPSSTVARRDQLQRIEENPNDVSNLGQSHDFSSKTPEAAAAPEKASESGITGKIANLTLTETGRDDSAFVDDDATNDEMPVQKKARESPQRDNMGNETAANSKTGSKSKSLFHIPGPGATKKVESHLARTTEISRNEGNLHYVVGVQAKNENAEPNSEYLDRVYGDERDFDKMNVDQSLLNEDDDDLCEEDFQQKRIIRWLMGVQTGSMAEQVVRDRTPPPSPQPNQQTAIVVVYNGDKNSW